MPSQVRVSEHLIPQLVALFGEHVRTWRSEVLLEEGEHQRQAFESCRLAVSSPALYSWSTTGLVRSLCLVRALGCELLHASCTVTD